MAIFLKTSTKDRSEAFEAASILSRHFHGLFSFYQDEDQQFVIGMVSFNQEIALSGPTQTATTAFQQDLNNTLKGLSKVTVNNVTRARFFPREKSIHFLSTNWRTILQFEYDSKVHDPVKIAKLFHDDPQFRMRLLSVHHKTGGNFFEVHIRGIACMQNLEAKVLKKQVGVLLEANKISNCNLFNILCDINKIGNLEHLKGSGIILNLSATFPSVGFSGNIFSSEKEAEAREINTYIEQMKKSSNRVENIKLGLFVFNSKSLDESKEDDAVPFRVVKKGEASPSPITEKLPQHSSSSLAGSSLPATLSQGLFAAAAASPPMAESVVLGPVVNPQQPQGTRMGANLANFTPRVFVVRPSVVMSQTMQNNTASSSSTSNASSTVDNQLNGPQQ